MAVLSEIRKRPILLMGIIALALLAFLVNPDSINKVFGKNPNVLGEVNGEKITRDEFIVQLQMLQQQAEQQGQPKNGLEEQAWQSIVAQKLIQQQFDKMGFELTDEVFWNQIQYDPMFAQNPQMFDAKGNFKVQDLKADIDRIKSSSPEQYKQWLAIKKSIEFRIMARQVFGNISVGVTTNKKEVETLMKYRDQFANIDYVKIDYANFIAKNPIKVSTQDIADYIKKHQTIFKSEPTRNLAIAYFPAKPSAEDEQKVKTEIEKLLNVGSDLSESKENFRNTTNDSMFVSLNSDIPFNPEYYPISSFPSTLQSQLSTASVGQIFGPYKENNVFVVSKLVGKKAQDSTLARHILISYKGNPAGADDTRSKDQAKKLADSIGAMIKANPAKFGDFVKFSSDKGSAANAGVLGWTVSTKPQYVPEFQKFVDHSPKGATAVVETQFGYHIINILDKKTSGTQVYKVANLVKTINPSEKSENIIDRDSKRFIQQVENKSFNEFKAIAKKNNYEFLNPKSLQRFQGAIQGVETDKADEILAWAFDKKRKVGETNIFSDATGNRVVVLLNGIYDQKLADPESVREQVEPIIINQLAAKKIVEKIKNSKINSLDQAVKLFGTTKGSTQINALNPSIENAMEPKVAGAAMGVAKNKLSQPVEGMKGVYLVVKKSEVTNKQPGDAKMIMQSLTQQNTQMFSQIILKSLQDGADIQDYRIEVWNTNKAQ